jgi:hypothetical protein
VWSLRLSFGGGVELSFAFLSQKRVRGPTLARVGKDCAITRDLDDEGMVAAQRAKRVCFERFGRSEEATGGEALARRFVLPLALVVGA